MNGVVNVSEVVIYRGEKASVSVHWGGLHSDVACF